MIGSVDNLSIKVLNKLNGDGYFFEDSEYDLEDYYELGKVLGNILLETDVQIDKKKKNFLFSDQPMPFHNDSPTAKYISWFCKEESNNHCPTRLLKWKSVLKKLEDEDIETLKNSFMDDPKMDSPGEFDARKLLWEENGQINIYYTPWLIKSGLDAKTSKALENLDRAIKEVSSDSIDIHLKSNQFFIIDNHQVLHARYALRPDSQRWLRRLWIGQH